MYVQIIAAPGQTLPRRGSGYVALTKKHRPTAGGGRPRPNVQRGPVQAQVAATQERGSLKRRNTMERAPNMPRGGQKQVANRKSKEFNPSFLQVAQPGAGMMHG